MKNKVELIDTISYQNPFYNACLIGAYLEGSKKSYYQDLFLVLPVFYYDDCVKYFQQTNKNTGILRWIFRNPEIILFFPTSYNDMFNLTKQAIYFMGKNDLLSVNENGKFHLKKNNFLNKIKNSDDELLLDKIKYANRFGQWITMLDDSKIVYQALGVSCEQMEY